MSDRSISVLFDGDKEIQDVAAFHMKFDMLVSMQQPAMLVPMLAMERADCIEEELREFREAVERNDMLGMADALIDITYFVKGTAVMMGLPWRALWDDVQGANMRKVRGKTHRNQAVDVMKPPGWVGPQTGAILLAHGFDVRAYLDPLQGQFDNALMATHPKDRGDVG